MRMQVEKYRRARLCRLCEGPVLDGGVQVTKPRIFKMSRWWKAHFDADLEMKQCTVCHFCCWELRFVDENSDEKEPDGQKWWRKNDKQSLYTYKYYEEEMLAPCSVKMAPLADKYLEEIGVESCHQRFKCLHCPNTYKTVDYLFNHAKAVHPEETANCAMRDYRKMFSNKEEQTPKVEKNRRFNCIYCTWQSKDEPSYRSHLYSKHKGEVIRCKYRFCKVQFQTEEERDQHFEEKHNFGNYSCSFCNRNFKYTSALREHMLKLHKEALKCNGVQKCPNYFKTEEDRQKHVLEKHPEAGNRIQCIYCLKTSSCAAGLISHMKNMHKCVFIKCEFQNCFNYFKNKEERQKHVEEVHEKHKFFCIYCDKFLATTVGFANHVTLSHSKEEVIRCTYKNCTTYFKTEAEKSAHIEEFHQGVAGKSLCVYCDKFFQHIREHVKKKHSDVAIKCEKFHCDSFFKNLEDREKHMKEKHSKVEKSRKGVPCLFCDKILLGDAYLRVHIRKKHLDVAIKCKFPNCGQFFKSTTDLENHFSSKPHHKEPPKKKLKRSFPCFLCPKTYTMNYDLQHHIKTFHQGKKDVCPHCKKITSSRKSHVISSNCKNCNQKFPCLGLLTEHKLKCRPAFPCLICAIFFEKRCDLKYHCLTKHRVLIQQWRGLQFKSSGFKCKECFVYLKSESSLKNHVLHKHTNSEFTCDFCHRKFARKNKLRQHIENNHLPSSTDDKCSICSKKFANKYQLISHCYYSHSVGNEYVECEICAKKMKKSSLGGHKKRMH